MRRSAVGVAAVAVFWAASARAQDEPGVAALTSARVAIGRLAAAAASPTSATVALGSVLADLAKPGEPASPARGQAIDSAAQPFLAALEPRIVELRERILDRRHRFLTGEDRPAPRKPDLRAVVFDVRSIVGAWRSADMSVPGQPPLLPRVDESPLSPSTIHVDGDKLRDLADMTRAESDGSVEISAGALLVRATEEGLERVAALLDFLRGETGRRVSVEVGAWRLPEDVRRAHADARSPEEAEKVLERALDAGKASLVASRTAVLEDGAVSHLVAPSTRSFVAEETVNQTGVVPVVNPGVARIDLGLRGVVRATIAPGRGDAIVDLDLAFRELKELKRETVADHEIALPETLVTRCATTVIVPLGACAIAGGTLAGSESAASACVFSVKVTRFTERRTEPRETAPVIEAKLAPATRPEVQELDALLAVVDEALARVREARRFELRLFDVRDVLEGARVRTAPRLGIFGRRPAKPTPAGGASFAFDDDSAGKGMAGGVLSFGGDDGRYDGPLGLEPEKLEAVLKNATGAGAAWGDPAYYELHAGEVIVRQTPGTLALIERMLAALRKDRVGNVEIAVDWCRVDDALLRELAGGGPALSREGVARLESAIALGERATRTAAGFVVSRRGDVGVLHGGVETAYVAGFEHASGGTGQVYTTVGVPLMGLVRQGLMLEAQGHGDLEGREGSLTLDARLGLARVFELPAAHTPTGPVTTPALDDAETAFDGVAPGGALVLVVGRTPGEKRPVAVAVLRARLVR